MPGREERSVSSAGRAPPGRERRVVPQLQQDAAPLVVPDDDAGIVGGRGQQRPVRGELTGHHVVVVPLQLPDQRVLVHVPEQDLQGEGGPVIASAVAASGREVPSLN